MGRWQRCSTRPNTSSNRLTRRSYCGPPAGVNFNQMVRLPVFQMKLGLDGSSRPGWLFADEGSDDSASFAFTIPYLPVQPFDQVELSLAGERDGTFVEFTLRFNGNVFVEPATQIRFSLHDVLGPSDFRGLAFANAFAYIGGANEILIDYGLSRFSPFLALAPLDLEAMDRVFLEQRLIFSG